MSAVLESSDAAAKLPPDLEALARSAGDTPPASSPAAAPPAASSGSAPVPGAIDYHQEARDLWRVIAMLKLRWPSVGQVLHDRAIEELATVWAPILERHKIDMGYLTIYFSAGIAPAPVVGDLWAGIANDRKAGRKAAPLPVPQASPACSSSPPPPPAGAAPKPLADQPAAAPPDPFKLHERA